ncbi:hypothetical protein CEXT_132021 [Caerostris extrusa]|uniref:Uncharacterized protein n=1 Tax=Caerostris extrusa TaxID=172846 RepID=A0AAV4Y4N6_CAEEX|nr:hypothetical protein CEXT_132021 [Caerostris extrusa]
MEARAKGLSISPLPGYSINSNYRREPGVPVLICKYLYILIADSSTPEGSALFVVVVVAADRFDCGTALFLELI